jgi:OOP family OmpA-OmpF porin
MRLRTALLATTLLAASSAVAVAQPIVGPYVSLGAGYNLRMSQGAHYSPTTAADGSDSFGGSKSTFRFGDGFNGSSSAGWGFGNGLRAELQGAYYYNTVNHRSGTPVAGITSGHAESYGALVNVLYDIDLAQFGIASPVTPYVGVGAGYMWNHLSPYTTSYTNGNIDRTGGTNGSFAYQGIIGAAYNIAPVPGLALTAEYRFLGQLDQEAYGSTSFTPRGEHTGNANFNDQFNHSFMLGVRYAFDTAPPPPPPPAPVVPAAPPAEARTYLVFFDWDKSVRRPGGAGFDPRADHPHRGQRLHRYVVDPWRRSWRPLQPGSFGPSRAEREGRADPRRRPGFGHRHPRLWREPSAGGDRPEHPRAAEPSR